MTQTEPFSVHTTHFYGGSKEVLYLHWHPEAELFFVQDGEMDFFIENDLYQLQRGDVIFVPPNLLHYAIATSEEDVVFRALVFATDLVAEPKDGMRFQKYVQPVLQDNRHYGFRLDAEEEWEVCAVKDLERIFYTIDLQKEGEDGSETGLLVEGLVRVIWHGLYCHHFRNIRKSKMVGQTEMQMYKIKQFIQDHYQEEITLSMLAKVVYISEAQLCRSFKQMTGNTIFAYLKKYRVLKSCEWLRSSDKKIQEICSLCGFNNISYYNREFLKIMKMTPSEYRRQVLGIEKSRKL